MENKKMLLVGILFALISAIILIVSFLNLLNIKIGAILIFICLGCQQLFTGLKLYKEDKKTGMFYILFGIVCFIFILWIVWKVFHLGLK